jgi:hypothetical protein
MQETLRHANDGAAMGRRSAAVHLRDLADDGRLVADLGALLARDIDPPVQCGPVPAEGIPAARRAPCGCEVVATERRSDGSILWDTLHVASTCRNPPSRFRR